MKKNLLSILFLSSLIIYSGAAQLATDYNKVFTDGEATVSIEKNQDSSTETKLVFDISIKVAEAKKSYFPISFTEMEKNKAIDGANLTSLKSAFKTSVTKDGSNAKKAYDEAKAANPKMGEFSESNITSAKKADTLHITMLYEVTVTADNTSQALDQVQEPEKIDFVTNISKAFSLTDLKIDLYSGEATQIEIGGRGSVKFSIAFSDAEKAKYVPEEDGITDEYISNLKKAITAEMAKDATASAFKTKYDEYIDSSTDGYSEAKIVAKTSTAPAVIRISDSTIYVMYVSAIAKKVIPLPPSN